MVTEFPVPYYLRNVTKCYGLMFVKIDTKAHFRVLTLMTPVVHANMAEELGSILQKNMETPPGNIILVFDAVSAMEDQVAEVIRAARRKGVERRVSLVWTGLRPSLRDLLCGKDETMAAALTPTLKEAIDWVMMEQLERDLMGPDPDEKPSDDQ